MATSLSQLAQLVNGQLRGSSVEVTGASTLSVAEAGEITLADSIERAAKLSDSPAAAAVVPAEIDCGSMPSIVVEDVHQAFAKIVEHFHPSRAAERPGVSELATVSDTAEVAEGVDIFPQAYVGEEVQIGAGSVIHTGAKILPGCVIGRNVTVFPNVVLYENTQLGDNTIIHSGSVLGAYGFGYRDVEGRHELSAQLGFVIIEPNVEIGACVTIDRGTYGPTIVGEGTKVDNLVQIAHNCRIGKHNLICSQVGIAGSTTTGDHVVMAGQVGVRDNVHIGKGAVLCSKAGVPNDVPEGEMVLGQPATPIRQQKLQMAAISKLPEMRREFRALQKQLAALTQQIESQNQAPQGEQAA